jgi:PAS domain S-box-containing protein
MAESIVESSAEAVLNVAKTVRIRVLHVDDDQICLKVGKQCLETQGEFEVDTASSVNEALEKLKKTDYDVIVSDYQMPGKDGLEFLKELRKKGNTVPLIIFTGKGREEIAMKALNLGASGYFNKQGHPETVYGELAHGIRQVTERKKTEMKMWEREERLRAVFHSSPDAITVSDLHGNILDCSEAAWKMFRFSSKEEAIGKSSFDFIAEKDRQEALENLRKTLEQGTTRNLEYTLLNKNGEKFWGELSASIVKDLLGNPVGFVGVIRDVSERKKAEQTLKESEEKFRSLVELAPDGIVAVNAEGIITSANRSFLTLVGYDSIEIVGKPFTELKSSRVEDIPKFQSMFKSLMKGESPSPVEFLYVRRDGTSRWAEVHPSLLTKDGNPVGAQVIMRDVTERKNAEEKLRSLNEFNENVIDSIADSLLVIDPNDYRITGFNEAALKRLMLRKEDLMGKTCYETTHHRSTPCEPPLHICPIQEVLKTGKTVTVEHTHFDKGNNEIFVEVSAHPVRNQEGNIVQLVYLSRDITERSESEEKFRVLAEQSPNMIFMNKMGKVFYANKKCEEIVGYRTEELCSPDFKFLTLIAPESIDQVKSTFRRHMEGEYVAPYECTLLTKEGKRITAIIATNLITYKGEKSILGMITDITERKKAEEEKSRLLDDLHARVKELNCLYGMSRLVEKSGISLDDALQGTADLLPPAVQYPDIACARIVVENREFSTRNFKETRWKLQADIEIFGKKVGSVEVRYLEERPTIAEGPFLKEERLLIDAVAERLGKITERMKTEQMLQESEERFRAIFEGANDGILAADTKTRRFSFANPRICEITGYSLEELLKLGVGDINPEKDLPYVIDSFEKQRQGKEALSKDIPVLRKDGRVVYCDVSSKSLKIGSQEYLIGIFRDVTESKKAEEKLRQNSDRIEMMNEKLHVVGGLSRHDVNNKLSAVTGYAYLLKKKHADQADIVEGLGMIEQAVKAVGKIFDFARMYEQLGVEELTYVDAEKTLDEAGALFSGLTIKVVNSCHGLTVLADSFLRQLFYNFIDNTRKYGGKATAVRVYYEKAESGELRLVYEDDGVGISAENKLKLFTEGFSTGGSTGFGLFLIRKMMDVYGWQIQETGEPGKGAKFVITIPKANLNGKENYQLS